MSRNKREIDLAQLFDNQRFAPSIVHHLSFIIHHYLGIILKHIKNLCDLMQILYAYCVKKNNNLMIRIPKKRKPACLWQAGESVCGIITCQAEPFKL
jgi:hypothetical protein